MRRWLVRGVLLVGVLALGFWAWRTFFPNPERVIRKRLTELTDLASFGPNEGPAAKLWNAQKLATMFTPDVSVKIDVPGQQGTHVGRDAIQNAALWARQTFGACTVNLTDIIITLAPDKQSAIVELTAKAQAGADAEILGPQELSLRMKKDGGAWYVSRVETVRTLR